MMRLLYFGFRIYCFIFRPKTLGVRVMLIQNGQVLLVRQTYLPGWYMPGGGVKRGETLEEAARREAREEVGAEMGELSLHGAYTYFGEFKSDHNILFLCTDFNLHSPSTSLTCACPVPSGPGRGGTGAGRRTSQPDREIAEVRFFSLDALPGNIWPGHRRRLEEYHAGLAHPQFGEW